MESTIWLIHYVHDSKFCRELASLIIDDIYWMYDQKQWAIRGNMFGYISGEMCTQYFIPVNCSHVGLMTQFPLLLYSPVTIISSDVQKFPWRLFDSSADPGTPGKSNQIKFICDTKQNINECDIIIRQNLMCRQDTKAVPTALTGALGSKNTNYHSKWRMYVIKLCVL